MKVYFTHSKRISSKYLQQIEDYLKSGNHTVLSRERSSDDSLNFEEAETVFKNNVKKIKNSDLILAECSYASSGLGYEISLALDEKKPVLAIYNMSDNFNDERHIKTVPVNLKGNTSKYLILREYGETDLQKTLDLSFDDAKALVDTKFILIISARIDRYLEWNARERGAAKAEVTREAIERAMKDDKKYQEYLKSNGFEE